MTPSHKKSVGDEEYRREFREIFAETGHRTLNALLIVTGGATVAFLTFIGTCLKELPAHDLAVATAAPLFALAVQCFVSSVGLCLLMHFTTYLSHGAYHFRYDRVGNVLGGVTVFLGFACLFVFLFGSIQAIRAIEASAHSLSPTQSNHPGATPARPKQ